MTRATRRDPVSDELLTPENSAFVLIDYQPTQVDSINSMDRAKLIDNIAVTGLTPFFRSGGSGSRPVARGCGQGDWSDHVEQQEAL